VLAVLAPAAAALILVDGRLLVGNGRRGGGRR
jgi:hypothetical protein